MSQKFQEYISQEDAESGLQSGNLVTGVLRVNPKRPADGFCVTGKYDILIKGKTDRNRAFNGDTIVVEVFPESEWHVASAGSDLKEGAEISNPFNAPIRDIEEDETLMTELKLQKLPSTPTVGSHLITTAPPAGVIKTGRVVFVSHAVWADRVYACSLHPNRTVSPDLEEDPKITEEDRMIRAVPIDKRIPWILIMLNDTVKKALKLPGELSPHTLYPIQVQKWDSKGALPLGRLKGVAYGKVGEPSVEARVCMSENGLQEHEEDFPKSVHIEVERMQQNFEEEVKVESQRRIDLRRKRIFTIDPATARDLDDAIHVDIIDKDFVEIGVHIADVSHYVAENSQVRIRRNIF